VTFLLTSSGISNATINDALVDLLGKPISDSTALIVPTGIYPFPGGADRAHQAICGNARSPFAELGWKALGVLELTALPSIQEDSWIPALREADVLYVWGGNVLYLAYWMRQSGVAALLPTLDRLVYVGCSAGSIVATPYNFDVASNLHWVPEGHEMAVGADRALGLVDFALAVHLDHEDFEDSSTDNVAAWAARVPVPTYAIDDQSAVRVVNGAIDVVSEGRWALFTP